MVTVNTPFLRFFAGLGGIGLLSVSGGLVALSHDEITPKVILTICGLVGASTILAILLGSAMHYRNYFITLFILLALMGSEFALFQGTAESTAITRANQIAPIQKQHSRREALKQAIAEARRSIPTTTPRLQMAQAGLKAFIERRDNTVKEKWCRSGCMKGLKDSEAMVVREHEAAVQDFQRREQAAHNKIKKLETELANLEAPPAIAPLAANLGIEAWITDLSRAFATSIGINGAGILALFICGHGLRYRPKTRKSKGEPEVVELKPVDNPREHFGLFCAAMLRECGDGGKTSTDAFYSLYQLWAKELSYQAMSRQQFARFVRLMVDSCGLEVERVGRSERYIRGVVPKNSNLLIEHTA